VNKKVHSTSLTRHDFQLISDWIEPDSRVIDLGCGDGRLLQHLQQHKNVRGYGVELSPSMIPKCINNGINVIQINLDQGLGHFDSDSFDFVILSLTLQAMRRPETLLKEMLRVGKQGIVTFPNFGYWRNRLQLLLSGTMPISDELPYNWYDTPNIHLCTIRDFQESCARLGFNTDESVAVHSSGRKNIGLSIAPSLFGEIALCRISKA